MGIENSINLFTIHLDTFPDKLYLCGEYVIVHDYSGFENEFRMDFLKC